MHIKHCILRSLDNCNIVVKTLFSLKSLAINYTMIWKNDDSVYYIQKKKKRNEKMGYYYLNRIIAEQKR